VETQPSIQAPFKAQAPWINGFDHEFVRISERWKRFRRIRVLVPNDWQASTEPIARVGIGSIQGNGNSTLASISSSGRVVAFVSTASNFVSGDDANPSVFVFERDPQSIVRVPIAGMNLQVLGIAGQEEQ
jgi:hypothetical protein